jgi:hypothetical protein
LSRFIDVNDMYDQRKRPTVCKLRTAVTPRIERPIPRRGLSRVEAAIYLGISPSKFDELRKSGRIGPAKMLDGRKLYAIEMLDEFFDTLPDENHDAEEDWTVRA